MSQPDPIIPETWGQLDLGSLRGVLMVVGAPDTGKSTFARYLFKRLSGEGLRVAYLDGDPGQSTLGPPTTLSLVIAHPGERRFPPAGQIWRWFIGSVSPHGHMLPLLVAAARLVRVGLEGGADVVVYDTCGLIDPNQGGMALKLAKIDLLQPQVLFAIQVSDELEPLLIPMRRSKRARVVDLSSSSAVRTRVQAARQAYRAEQFAGYFRRAGRVDISWSSQPVFPAPRFALNRLVSLDDANGFALGLGIVLNVNRQMQSVELLTPLPSLEGVQSITLGDISLDRETFRDSMI